ncbi:MAG: J domain-containing protein [Pseudomonadota bacterium]
MKRSRLIGLTTPEMAAPVNEALGETAVEAIEAVAAVFAPSDAPLTALRIHLTKAIAAAADAAGPLRKRVSQLSALAAPKLTDQRIEAATLARGPFLPVLGDDGAAGTQSARELIKPYSESLRGALEKYGRYGTYRLESRWDVSAVVAELEQTGALPRALSLPAGALRRAHRHDVAQSLAEAMDARKKTIQKDVARAFEAANVAWSVEEPPTPGVAAVGQFIATSSELLVLGRTLSALRERFGLRFRVDGPSKTLSLAHVAVIDASPRCLEAALAALGLPADPTRADVKAAYHRAIKRNHPDMRRGGEVDGALIAHLRDAYETLIWAADRQGAAAPEDEIAIHGPVGAGRALRLRIGPEGRGLAASAAEANTPEANVAA